jgi:hypothetical protein
VRLLLPDRRPADELRLPDELRLRERLPGERDLLPELREHQNVRSSELLVPVGRLSAGCYAPGQGPLPRR